jgi:hypothetical protein
MNLEALIDAHQSRASVKKIFTAIVFDGNKEICRAKADTIGKAITKAEEISYHYKIHDKKIRVMS